MLLLLTASGVAGTGAKRRLVSICLPGDQLLLQLAPREEVVALSWLATDPDLSPQWREAQGIPTTRGGAEELLSLKPDLVFVGVYSTPATNAMLRRLKIPVMELGVPEDFEQLRAQIRAVAERLGTQEQGEAIIRRMDARLARVAAKAGEPRPTALFYFQDGFSPGGGTFADAILEAAGFTNLGKTLGRSRSASVPLETVILAKPEFLILTAYQEAHPTLNAFSPRHPLLRRLETLNLKIASIPFRQLACPNPENLDLVETLHRLRLNAEELQP